MSLLRQLENRFYRRIRSPAAADVAAAEAVPWSAARLQGHKYCLLTSYRATGQPVSTPVWFGVEDDRLYVRSGAEDGKVKRIRRNPEVSVAPCTARGRPLDRPMTARARILAPDRQAHAEAVLGSSYGLGRKLYRLLRPRISVAYLELTAPR